MDGAKARNCTRAIEEARVTAQCFKQLGKELATRWKTPESRIIGHIVYSPPVDSSPTDNFTYDWCLYEIDVAKVRGFSGNIIDLGHEVTPETFKKAMNPDVRNPYKFVYPADRLLKVRNACIPLEEMRCPKTFTGDDVPYIPVFKRGKTTGITLGRANEVTSYTRTYGSDGTPGSQELVFQSQEWAITGLEDFGFHTFSKRGDSGSLVVDAQGRMGGLITDGSSELEVNDVTYATPMVKLLADMERHGWRRPNANVDR